MKCGTKVEVAERLSADESIALAKSLEQKYEQWGTLKDEIDELERELPRYQLPAKPVRYSAFKFFWPFLIYSQIAQLVVCVIFIVVLFSSGSASRYLDDTDSLKTIMTFFALLATGATLIIGGIYAGKKRDRKNSELIASENSVLDKKHKIESRLIELKSRRSMLEQELRQYNGWIPVSMRSAFYIKRARSYIENGEASDLYEAVMLLQR
jgi:hypothetical protein